MSLSVEKIFTAEVKNLDLRVSSHDKRIKPKDIHKYLKENVALFSSDLSEELTRLNDYLKSKKIKSKTIEKRLKDIASSIAPKASSSETPILNLNAGVYTELFTYLNSTDKSSLAQTCRFFFQTLQNLSKVKTKYKNFLSLDEVKGYLDRNKQIKLLDLSGNKDFNIKQLKTLNQINKNLKYKINIQSFHYNSDCKFPKYTIDYKTTSKALDNKVAKIDINQAVHIDHEILKAILDENPGCKFNLKYDVVKFENVESFVFKHPETIQSLVLSADLETLEQIEARVNKYTAQFSGKIHFITPPLSKFGTVERLKEFFESNGKHFKGITLTMVDEEAFNDCLPLLVPFLKHVRSFHLVSSISKPLDVSEFFNSFEKLTELALENTANIPNREVLKHCKTLGFKYCMGVDYNFEMLARLTSLYIETTENKFPLALPQNLQMLEIQCTTDCDKLIVGNQKELREVRFKGPIKHISLKKCEKLTRCQALSNHKDFRLDIEGSPFLKEVASNRKKKEIHAKDSKWKLDSLNYS